MDTDEKLLPPEPVNVTDFEEKSQLIVEPTSSNIQVIENDTIEQSKGDVGFPVAAIAAAMTATVAVVAAATAAKASDSKTKTGSDEKAGKPGSGNSAVSGKPAPGSAPKKKAEPGVSPAPADQVPVGPTQWISGMGSGEGRKKRSPAMEKRLYFHSFMNMELTFMNMELTVNFTVFF